MEGVPSHEARVQPLMNDQPLKLGIFCINVSGGAFVSDVETTYEATWEHSLAIAELADSMGFELVVPIARWLGFGGRINFHGRTFETLTWASAIAARTTNCMVFSTIILPTLHPVYAAKAIATMDHVSDGRIGLNVVMGWHPGEMAEFGLDVADHNDRYVYGQEWIDIVNKLWTSEVPFDHDGRFFQLKGCFTDPKPTQSPRPVLVNAGGSPTGLDFSARNVDFNFASFTTPEATRAHIDRIHDLAHGYGRSVGVLTIVVVICRDTEEEAKSAYQSILNNVDWEAAENFNTGLLTHTVGTGGSKAAETDRRELAKFAAAGGTHTLVGTPEQIVDGLQEIKDAGIDGVFIEMIDYVEELPFFEEKVMPLLKERGLRF